MGSFDEIGIDSGFFSQALCISIASFARAALAGVDPRDLLASGFKQIPEDAGIKGGASTACLGVYKPDGVLSVAKWVPNGATLRGGC